MEKEQISLDVLYNEILPEVLELIKNYTVAFRQNVMGEHRVPVAHGLQNVIPKRKAEEIISIKPDRDEYGIYSVVVPDGVLVQTEFDFTQLDDAVTYQACVNIMPNNPVGAYKIDGAQAPEFVTAVVLKSIEKYRQQQLNKTENILKILRDYNQRKK